MAQAPPTRFARSGDARIAYQVFGSGPVDLVMVGGPASHVDLVWEEPGTARMLERIGSFARAVMFDRRGTGLSDPVEDPPTLEQQMDDLRAVKEDVGLRRVALYGATDGGLCALYAATYPEEVTALVLADVAAGGDYMPRAQVEEMLDIVENSWGLGAFLPVFAPSRVGDQRFEAWWGRYERACVSPSIARKIIDFTARIDLRSVLGSISAPTLVLHRSHNTLIPLSAGHEVAALIPGARFAAVPGRFQRRNEQPQPTPHMCSARCWRCWICWR